MTAIANGAAISGRREIDATLFGLRVGPYWEIPFSNSISLSLEPALFWKTPIAAFFQESVTIAGSGTAFSSGTDNENEFLVGDYLSGQVSVAVTECWHIQGTYCSEH